MNPALVQRLVTFNAYFWGFLILDRLSFFGEPPSTTETWVMALILGLAVTLLSPMVAGLLGQRPTRGRRNLNGPVHIDRDRMARDSVDADLGL